MVLRHQNMHTLAEVVWRAGCGGVAREISMRSMVGGDGCGGWSWRLIMAGGRWCTSSNGLSEVMPLAIEVEFLLAQIRKQVSV